MNLVRLIYASTLSDDTTFDDMQNVTASARKNNKQNGITGFLTISHAYALQILEGDRGIVSSVYNKIAKDTRHRNLTLLCMTPITQRKFDRWEMEYCEINDRHSDLIFMHGSSRHFNPYNLSAENALSLLSELHDQFAPATTSPSAGTTG